MLNRLPRPTEIPPLALMLDDIGRPSAARLARALGVTARTAQRWLVAGRAPRPVLLALFFLTRWGWHLVHCEAHNAAVLYAMQVRTLGAELAALREQRHAPPGRAADQVDDDPQHERADDGRAGVDQVGRMPRRMAQVIQLFAQADRDGSEHARRGRAGEPPGQRRDRSAAAGVQPLVQVRHLDQAGLQRA